MRDQFKVFEWSVCYTVLIQIKCQMNCQLCVVTYTVKFAKEHGNFQKVKFLSINRKK